MQKQAAKSKNQNYKDYDFAMQGGTAKKESLQTRKDILTQSWAKWEKPV